MCGQQRSAQVVASGAKVLARPRVDGKRPGRSSVLKIASCDDGRWVTTSRAKTRTQRRVPTAQDADLRITWHGRSSFVRAGQGPATRVPVSFRVRNQNRIPLPCPVDGRMYTVRGHVTAPASTFEPGGEKTTTLYNTGHSFDEQLWTYGGVEGYDFTSELAKKGHASVTYDRLGYDKSDLPDGNRLCYSSEGDVIDQMIGKLKAGDYQLEGRSAVRFGRVALAGISQGALVNEAVASTFKSQDALLHFGFVPAAFVTTPIAGKFATQLADCAANSQPANQKQGNPRGYAFRGRTDADFRGTNFVNTDPKVVADFTARRKVDPCGLPLFVGPQIAYAAANDHQIRGPVLVAFGAKDANFFPQGPALDAQAALFSGSSDVSTELIPETGHMLPLERTAPRFQTIVSNWLERHGF